MLNSEVHFPLLLLGMLILIRFGDQDSDQDDNRTEPEHPADLGRSQHVAALLGGQPARFALGIPRQRGSRGLPVCQQREERKDT